MARRSACLVLVITACGRSDSAPSSPPTSQPKPIDVAAVVGSAAPPAPAKPEPKPVAAGMHRYTVKSLGITIDVKSTKIAEVPWGDSDMGTPAVHLAARDSSFEVYLSNGSNDRYDMNARAKLEQSYTASTGGATTLRLEPTKDGGWEYEFRDNGNADFGFHARIVLDGKPFECGMSSENQRQLDELIAACHSIALAP